MHHGQRLILLYHQFDHSCHARLSAVLRDALQQVLRDDTTKDWENENFSPEAKTTSKLPNKPIIPWTGFHERRKQKQRKYT